MQKNANSTNLTELALVFSYLLLILYKRYENMFFVISSNAHCWKMGIAKLSKRKMRLLANYYREIITRLGTQAVKVRFALSEERLAMFGKGGGR